jgi:hypothetical protein
MCTVLLPPSVNPIAVDKYININLLIVTGHVEGEHLLRIDRSRVPKIAFEHNSEGRKHVGCPRKRWAL